MASHTSGTTLDIYCLDILKRYIKLVYQSPVAKKRIMLHSAAHLVKSFPLDELYPSQFEDQ